MPGTRRAGRGGGGRNTMVRAVQPRRRNIAAGLSSVEPRLVTGDTEFTPEDLAVLDEEDDDDEEDEDLEYFSRVLAQQPTVHEEESDVEDFENGRRVRRGGRAAAPVTRGRRPNELPPDVQATLEAFRSHALANSTTPETAEIRSLVNGIMENVKKISKYRTLINAILFLDLCECSRFDCCHIWC